MKPAPLLLALLLASTPAPAQEAAPPHVDWEGNPLPAEAVARGGSARFRADGGIRALALSADEKTLAGLSLDFPREEGALTFWDTATGRPLRRFPMKLAYRVSLHFSADGETVTIFSAGIYRVLNVASGKQIRRWIAQPEREWDRNIMAPDGKLLANWDHEAERIIIFDTVGRKAQCTIDGIRLHGWSFSPDGKSLAVSYAKSKGIEFFDARTGKRDFELPQGDAGRFAFSPDGNKLAVALFGTNKDPKSIVIWDMKTRKPIAKLEASYYSAHYIGIKFSPNSKQVFLGLGKDDSVLVDSQTGKVTQRFRTWGSIEHAIFSKDGEKVYTASVVGFEIQPWSTVTGQRLSPSSDPPAFPRSRHHITLSLHGRDLLLANDTLTRLDWRSGRTLQRYPTARNEDEWYKTDALSPDGKWLASLARGQVQLLDAKSGKVLRAMPTGGPTPSTVFFSHDSATLSGYSYQGGFLHRWEIPGGKKLSETHVFAKKVVRGYFISPDRLRLAIVDFSQDRAHAEISILEAGDERIHRTIHLKGMMTTEEETVLSPSGKELATAIASEEKICVFDTATGKLRKAWSTGRIFTDRMERNPDGNRYTPMALSGDGRNLAGIEDSPTLWEVATGKVRHRFQGHQAWIQSMVFHPDGSLLAAASADAPIFIWDVYGKHLNKKPPVEQWSDANGQRYWHTLASDDAAKAFGAVRVLVQNPPAALKLLDERLQPVKAIEERRFLDLVKGLDDENFAKRKKALAELEQLGEQVEGWVLRETEAKQPLEVQRRLEQIVAKLDARSGDSLRGTRALEALEQIGGAEAEKLVTRLADGFAAARLTREARETRERMRKGI